MKKLVVLNSIIALILIYLAFKIDWLFLAGAVLLMIINQKLLLNKK